MSALFDDDEDVLEPQEDGLEDAEAADIIPIEVKPGPDARRRLEKLLEARRLREELDDFPDE
ncbi:hypothetical protein Lgee_1264 [Legionella geestiana]|uniref:Uncharacterized protein n=1 Tax=Legionella geestiana TaxID=45065 RepID=A0A0W0TTZ5_9GAMM|nr:hypothetical protein [Legionella geestiana]KTC98998.1 hypothetical protein Lgee_1264 [Legionella geestiana]QBS12667.1 hypothetical protein E4T54_07875 [Legionella geestiana]QDQ39615.1 hypothetical protein E3226_003975 [Legionella geestiana]STX54870.1 Uncharacterised protein [Legionella geestiana]